MENSNRYIVSWVADMDDLPIGVPAYFGGSPVTARTPLEAARAVYPGFDWERVYQEDVRHRYNVLVRGSTGSYIFASDSFKNPYPPGRYPIRDTVSDGYGGISYARKRKGIFSQGFKKETMKMDDWQLAVLTSDYIRADKVGSIVISNTNSGMGMSAESILELINEHKLTSIGIVPPFDRDCYWYKANRSEVVYILTKRAELEKKIGRKSTRLELDLEPESEPASKPKMKGMRK